MSSAISISDAIKRAQGDMPLIRSLSKATGMDEKTIDCRLGFALSHGMFNSVEAIEQSGYAGDQGMALAYFAGRIEAINKVRRGLII